MPLSRLENFLINTDGNILYVNPSDLDATDSFDNKGNSLTRPFKTIQRALIEAARFAYQAGPDNDKFDNTTILLYPGTHLVDNRPGLYIKNNGGTAQFLDFDKTVVSGDLELTNASEFDLGSASNILYKFNSVEGGVIVPKGTSIVGLDLRKTKVVPLYVPDPDPSKAFPRSAIFKITGGCYFWQFSLFDGVQDVYVDPGDFSKKAAPSFSHHKLTCFEYADGVNENTTTNLTDLQMYYFKLMNAYGNNTGNREIVNFPTNDDFQPNNPEFKIVGDLVSDDLLLSGNATSDANAIATVNTEKAHGLTQNDTVRIVGISSNTYNGRFKVTGITSERTFSYKMLADPDANVVSVTPGTSKAIIEIDNVNGASPYIFNISLRSAFGMCGMHADGSKATGFKSMVVAQFTGIGLQNDDEAFVIYNPVSGVYDTNSSTDLVNRPLHLNQEAIYKQDYTNFHIKSSNDAVIQAVSVFAIGFAEHFVSVDGGDQSITNSNSNFGAKSLTSTGFRKQSFDRDDTGYITHIVPPKDLQQDEFNVGWKTLNATSGASGISTSGALYILGEVDENNPPTNISNGFRIGAKEGEILFLDVTIDGVAKTFSSRVVMQSKSGTEVVASKKDFKVASFTKATDTPASQLTLDGTHNFLDGESVRIYSDNGVLPDGIEYGRQYYVIDTGATTIRLSKTFNGAIAATPENIDIKNTLGGGLRVCSTVTDKIPGEPGHPIQFDSDGWFVITDTTFFDSNTENTIFNGFQGFGTAISANNSATYVKRKNETRDLKDRTYRVRYSIPKEFVNAKAPEKNFIIQESKTVKDETTINDMRSHRNPRVIAGITTTGFVATVTTEVEHGLSVNDVVRLKNVVSDINLDTDSNTNFNTSGLNGYFTVTEVPTSRTFKFTNPKSVGMGIYVDRTHSCRDTNDSSATLEDLPVFERNEYDTTYIIENVEQLQEYIPGQQDGVYYLTLLTGNVTPTVSQFNAQKFKQSPYYLYPVVDKDNLVLDPLQSISVASNSLIGKTLVDDAQHSLTKESTINYLKDNRVGYALTGAEADNFGEATIFLAQNHSLNAVERVDLVTNGGTNYGNVASGTTSLYNVPTTADFGDGEGCTLKLTVTNKIVTAAEVMNGGCAYTDATTLTITGGDNNAKVRITVLDSSNTARGVELIGIGTAGNKNNSGYNGLYRVTEATKPKQFKCGIVGIISDRNNPSNVTQPIGSNPGTFAASPNAMAIFTGNGAKIAGTVFTTKGIISSPSGISTVETVNEHGFAVGNRVKLSGIAGVGHTEFSEKSFIVQKVVSSKKFEIKNPHGDTPDVETNVAFVLRHSMGATGEDTSLTTEKINGRMFPMTGKNIDRKLNGDIGVSAAAVGITSTAGIEPGDFIQVSDEIMRVKSLNVNGTSMNVIRGVLGSKSAAHSTNDLIKLLKVVPSEVRRFSSIRASGHTFEYIGYGPGNYSTALPQKQVRVISEEEEFLAISKEQKGGVTFFSGMNDRGEFFTWDGRIVSRENFLGEVGSDASNVFDDLYVRNTLRVGGGPNQNLPSEFRGPVNFIKKITSTSVDGIDAIKLILKGTQIADPFFQVGPDASPSLIVNQATQLVGIKTATPEHELDINGTIRASVYENFKLTDLPNNISEETTFGRNRILKVNDKGTGYELVDIHEIDSFALRSYGISNDGTVHTGIGTVLSTADAKALIVGSGTTFTSAQLDTKLGSDGALQVTGIGTARFFVGETCKIFGVTSQAQSSLIANPVWTTMSATKTGSTSGSSKMYYWVAQYNFNDGRVGIASEVTAAGVSNLPTIGNFNDQDHVTLTLSRTDTNHGLLVYRQYSAGGGDNANIGNAELIGILGDKELTNSTSNITYKDYGTYDQVSDWSYNGSRNQFTENQIHFPNIATTGHRRGFGVAEVIAIGASTLTFSESLIRFNDSAVGFGTTSRVRVTHENTAALSRAIDDTIESGGNYLDLPSGTYLTNKLVIPTGFTLRGNGKNTVVKRQFFANDGDGNLVGIGSTSGRDITIQDLTIDGNSGNNIRYGETSGASDSYLVYLPYLSSTTLKNMEIRNSSEHGLWIKNSTRLSMDGCAIVDGSQTDRYEYHPINAQSSSVLRLHDSLFENYPAAVDISSTEVTSTGGNIIRNCGSGIKIYASGKISTKDNIILGPSDEHIPSPDIFDSDFDSVNVSIDPNVSFDGPTFLYIRDGEPYNIAENAGVIIISAGIGSVVGSGSTDEVLGDAFEQFDLPTVDNDPSKNDRTNGFLKIALSPSKTVGFSTRMNQPMGYEIIAEEYLQQPVSISTYAGISTGAWYKTGSAFIGAGVTNYLVTLETPGHFQAFSVDQVVKLVNHQTTPTLSSQLMVLEEKKDVSATVKQLRFRLVNNDVGLTTASVTSVSNAVGGYISIRDRFVIAKGRVGVI